MRIYFLLCTIFIILVILAIVFSPAITAFYIAGTQDGFTMEAFDYGPSSWWYVGSSLLVLGIAAVCGIAWKLLSIGGKQ